MFASEHFDFHPVGRGVWAAIAKPESGASSNSGIVDLGASTLVFDTSLTPAAAKDLRSAARVFTGRDPSIAVNSHWHLDHTLGNQVFGSCSIYGTSRTQDLLLAAGESFVAGLASPAWRATILDLEGRVANEAQPLLRTELRNEIAARKELNLGEGAVRLRLPDELFTDRVRFPGDRGATIVEGAGHSESDSILFVSDEEVLFTGDLVTVETHPNLQSCDPERWRRTLGRIEAIRPRVVVPGHGPVTDISACAILRAYLEDVRDRALKGGHAAIPEAYRGWTAPSRYDRNVAAAARWS